MLNDILKAIGDGVEKELIHLKDYNLNPCDACYSCTNGGRCHIKDDVKRILDSMVRAEAVIIGSSVYYGSVTPEVKMLCDRIGFMSGGKLEGKTGVSVTVARRWGHIYAMMQITVWFLNLGIIVLGTGGGWFSATARNIDDFKKDKEGMEITKKMGTKIRELLDKLFK